MLHNSHLTPVLIPWVGISNKTFNPISGEPSILADEDVIPNEKETSLSQVLHGVSGLNSI